MQAFQNLNRVHRGPIHFHGNADGSSLVGIKLEQTDGAALLLPNVLAYVESAPSGLGGALDPSLTDVTHNRYGNYAYGLRLSVPLGNRTAQADATRALLEKRQLEMQLQQAQNQSVWDVSKAVSAVQQGRGQLDATLQLSRLARQVVEVEKKKFAFALAQVNGDWRRPRAGRGRERRSPGSGFLRQGLDSV
jgi:Outer membrane efflux protein